MAVAALWRERLGPERAQAALEMALLRQRAERTFSRAAEMFFTRDGLEQATAEPVAAHRAARFAAAGARTVADLGWHRPRFLAGAGADVVAIDRDLRLLMAKASAAVYGLTEALALVQADLLALPPLPVDAFSSTLPGAARGAPSRLVHGRGVPTAHSVRCLAASRTQRRARSAPASTTPNCRRMLRWIVAGR
jgi:hypothetical protein